MAHGRQRHSDPRADRNPAFCRRDSGHRGSLPIRGMRRRAGRAGSVLATLLAATMAWSCTERFRRTDRHRAGPGVPDRRVDWAVQPLATSAFCSNWKVPASRPSALPVSTRTNPARPAGIRSWWRGPSGRVPSSSSGCRIAASCLSTKSASCRSRETTTDSGTWGSIGP